MFADRRAESLQTPRLAQSPQRLSADSRSSRGRGTCSRCQQRAMDWLDTKPVRSRASAEHGDFLRQLSANAGYASLVSIVTATLSSRTSDTPAERRAPAPQSSRQTTRRKNMLYRSTRFESCSRTLNSTALPSALSCGPSTSASSTLPSVCFDSLGSTWLTSCDATSAK